MREVEKKETRKMAIFLHEEYENAAKQMGWETQEKCRVPFGSLPEENQKTMLLVALRVNKEIQSQIQQREKQLLGMVERIKSNCCNFQMTVAGDEEGTQYYVCNSCLNPCGPKYDHMNKFEEHNGGADKMIKPTNEETMEEKEQICCVCGEAAKLECYHCKNHYCNKHYETTVMTGNCCSGNEKDYE